MPLTRMCALVVRRHEEKVRRKPATFLCFRQAAAGEKGRNTHTHQSATSSHGGPDRATTLLRQCGGKDEIKMAGGAGRNPPDPSQARGNEFIRGGRSAPRDPSPIHNQLMIKTIALISHPRHTRAHQEGADSGRNTYLSPYCMQLSQTDTTPHTTPPSRARNIM